MKTYFDLNDALMKAYRIAVELDPNGGFPVVLSGLADMAAAKSADHVEKAKAFIALCKKAGIKPVTGEENE